MLNSKQSLQLKLLVRLLNSGNLSFSSYQAVHAFALGRYYRNLVLNNSVLILLSTRFLRFVDTFLGQNHHIFFMFAENTSPYFLLQMAALVLKTRHRVSLCQEKYWAPGILTNRRLLALTGKKSSKNFYLLSGFNAKPDLILLFGVTNFFIVNEFMSSNLPTMFFCLNQINVHIPLYRIPKVNTFLLEDFIFVFIVKYTFFAR